jgi:hypothetical protein
MQGRVGSVPGYPGRTTCDARDVRVSGKVCRHVYPCHAHKLNLIFNDFYGDMMKACAPLLFIDLNVPA